ncbi:SRPBCC domain-containing protein [Chitinophaga sp.]|uniref:SRPBCC family protein n=1 Tax=Chitinophaga sp. TaxID=1869181 RepID=UPI0031D7B1F8
MKTQIHAEDGQQQLTITREFELPVALLFRAYEDADIVAQWMNTKVVKLENKRSGSWQFDTCDDKGNIAFTASGVYHEFVPNKKITRTFEMGNAPFDVQLEFLEFEALDEDNSKLTMQIVYRSGALRDQMLKLPFRQGLNMAHNRLQEVVTKLK